MPKSETPRSASAINWVPTLFLAITLVVALVTTPLYLLEYGIGWFEVSLAVVMFLITGLGITVGYHRLFSHKAFDAPAPIRLLLALGGAGAFEGSAIDWSSDHRHHHKHTDQEGHPGDPHSIARGFLWAHCGWLIVYREDKAIYQDNTADLERDPILAWQHKHFVWIGILVGFLLPMAAGTLLGPLVGMTALQGLFAGFVFGGCTRVVLVQHSTFLINSVAHMIGRKPYDGEISARDNGVLALFTFGEGYHNFHHAFQNDYRNGVRWWQWDPSKWTIWTLSKLGLAGRLRRTPPETIRLARIREQRRSLEARMSAAKGHVEESVWERMCELQEKIEDIHLRGRVLLAEYSKQARNRMDRQRESLDELKREIREFRREFRRLTREWKISYREMAGALPAAA